jgi:hypothetical protein
MAVTAALNHFRDATEKVGKERKMPEITINVEVFCGKCGAGLCRNTDVTSHHGQDAFTVEPCQRCLDREYEVGYEAGKADTERELNKEGI